MLGLTQIEQGSRVRIGFWINSVAPNGSTLVPFTPSAYPLITVYDANGTIILDQVSVSNTYSQGHYYYSFTVPANSVLGIYQVQVSALDNTNALNITPPSNSFEVVN